MSRAPLLAVVGLLGILAGACTVTSGVEVEFSDAIGDAGASTDADDFTPTTEAPGGDPTGSEAPTTDADDGSTLDWVPCDDAALIADLECSTLEVPLDHDEPDGVQIQIAIARLPSTGATEDRIGSLVFNPGGPGGSGIDLLQTLPVRMSAEILERFDLVGFDPRGVGASTALDCDDDVDDQIQLVPAGDDAAWQALVDDTTEQLATCSPRTLELAPFVGTNNAARDLDLLREALGDEGLSYVGYSYGTRLGATYAELFPDRVRALVLDGGVKPTSDLAELSRGQAGGFDLALNNFAAACDADQDCVLQEIGPALEVYQSVEDAIDAAGAFATEDPDRILTPGEMRLGVIAALYSRDAWPFLASALYSARLEGNGTLLQVLGDSLLGRRADGTYDNSNIANTYINCADTPVREELDTIRAVNDDVASLSVYFDEVLRASTNCYGIAPARDPLIIGPATGSAPLLVVGNTGDPATPFAWSVELAESLDEAVLFTVEVEGHTAYGTIACATDPIDDYLIDLEVPEPDGGCVDGGGGDVFVPSGEGELDQVIALLDCLRDNGLDIPELSEADVLADPTLESVFGQLDLADPAFGRAAVACQELLEELN